MWALSLAVVPALVGRVFGQTTNAQCINSTDYNWSFNTLGQSPCLMAAYMMGACEPGGGWDIQALPDHTFTYDGPTADQATVCTCSSVSYALSSACGYCQGGAWPEWAAVWTQNCPSDLVNNGSFPHPIPEGTRIPEWAFVPIDGFVDTFDAVQAQDIGDKLETTGTASPTGTPTSNSTGSGNTSTQTSSTSDTASNGGHSGNIGTIVGGVIGGLLAFVCLIGLTVYFFVVSARRKRAATRSRRRRKGPTVRQKTLPQHDTLPVVNYDAPPSSGGTVDSDAAGHSASSLKGTVDHSDSIAPTSPSPPPVIATTALTPAADPASLRIYNPSDPTTFPPTPVPMPQPSVIDMTQVTYPNMAHQGHHPIPEL